MGKLRQAQTRNQREQGCVGHGAGIVDRLGFPTERKGDGLRRAAARKMEGAIPGCQQRECQQHRERHPCRKVGGPICRGDLNRPGTQPVGQQRFEFRPKSEQRGIKPS